MTLSGYGHNTGPGGTVWFCHFCCTTTTGALHICASADGSCPECLAPAGTKKHCVEPFRARIRRLIRENAEALRRLGS